VLIHLAPEGGEVVETILHLAVLHFQNYVVGWQRVIAREGSPAARRNEQFELRGVPTRPDFSSRSISCMTY
jgi:hypothetical protein